MWCGKVHSCFEIDWNKFASLLGANFFFYLLFGESECSGNLGGLKSLDVLGDSGFLVMINWDLIFRLLHA